MALLLAPLLLLGGGQAVFDDPAFEETDWHLQPRTATFELLGEGSDGFRWTSVGPDEEDVLVAEFDGRSVLRLVLDHNGTHIETVLEMQGVAEFEDLDQDGHFSFGDPIVQHYRFSDMVRNWTVENADGVMVFRLSQSGQFKMPHIATTFTLPLDRPGTTIGVSIAVTAFPLGSAERSHLAATVRFGLPLSVAGGHGIYRANETTAFVSWSAPQQELTLQRYGLADQTTILVQSTESPARPSNGLELGFVGIRSPPDGPLPSDPTPVTTTYSPFEDVQVTDWRLWAIGFLVALAAGIAYLGSRMARRP